MNNLNLIGKRCFVCETWKHDQFNLCKDCWIALKLFKHNPKYVRRGFVYLVSKMPWEKLDPDYRAEIDAKRQKTRAKAQKVKVIKRDNLVELVREQRADAKQDGIKLKGRK